MQKIGEQPVTEESLPIFFREQLEEHSKRLRPPPNEDTRWYLGELLTRFCRSENLFAFQDGEFNIRPLALLYGDAMQAGSDHERCLLLQQLGDMALFLGALFPQRFSRRGIQQDYVVGMGGGAYDYLADNARQNRHVFGELATMFTGILDLVAAACCKDDVSSDETIIALYRRWLETGDRQLGRQLQLLGVTLPETSALH
jgi:hypothetical protein